MRTSVIAALMPTTRSRLLATMYVDPDRERHLREIALGLGLTASSLQRELERLTEAGLLAKRKDGNRTYYKADRTSPVFNEIRALVIKTIGVVEPIADALNGIGGVELAFVYGSMASGQAHNFSDVDLFVVGSSSLLELADRLHAAEILIGRPVNVTLYTREELEQRLFAKNSFVLEVLNNPRIDIIGDSNELAATSS